MLIFLRNILGTNCFSFWESSNIQSGSMCLPVHEEVNYSHYKIDRARFCPALATRPLGYDHRAPPLTQENSTLGFNGTKPI